MPFTTTEDLPSDPLVTVKFSGLQVIQPGANNTCDVGVHRFNRTHLFQVMLIVSKPGQAPILIPLLSGPLQEQFVVRLEPDTAGNFMVFETGNFDPTSPSGNNPNDARWAINLQSTAGDIRVNEGAMPFVTLKTGVLFTSVLSDPSLRPTFTRPPGAAMVLPHIAAELAAAITPPANTKVVLEWTDMGNPLDKTLPLEGDDPATTRYTVYFMNEPPNMDAEPHDEFILYYRILRRGGQPIPDVEQCTLTFPRGVRLDQIPCNPVRLDP